MKLNRNFPSLIFELEGLKYSTTHNRTIAQSHFLTPLMHKHLKYIVRLGLVLRTYFTRTKEDWGHYIIATKRGLYELKGKKVRTLLWGDFYGITIAGHTIYALKRIENQKSKIIQFPYTDRKVNMGKRKLFADNLDWGCHQMDYFNNHFYVADTYNNCILKIDQGGRITQQYYPLGTLQEGRSSSNYAHINSIYANSSHIYMMCHNETTKTNKNSTILMLNEALEVIKTIETDSSNAHNVVIFDKKIYHCDSFNSTVLKNNSIFFKTSYFTRGLSISKDYLVVGGSEYSSRKNRQLSKGAIFFLNHSGKLLDTIVMPSMVQEIRRLDEPDHGLSK